MPTPNVSIVDLVVQVEKKTFAEEVNAAFREAAAGPMNGVLAVTDEPLVSVDFRCTDVSTSIDSSLTMVMGARLALDSAFCSHSTPDTAFAATSVGMQQAAAVAHPVTEPFAMQEPSLDHDCHN